MQIDDQIRKHLIQKTKEQEKLKDRLDDFAEIFNVESEEERELECAIRFGESYHTLRPVFDQCCREKLLMDKDFVLISWKEEYITCAPASSSTFVPLPGVFFDQNCCPVRTLMQFHGKFTQWFQKNTLFDRCHEIDGLMIRQNFLCREVPGIGGYIFQQPMAPEIEADVCFYLDQASSRFIEFLMSWKNSYFKSYEEKLCKSASFRK